MSRTIIIKKTIKKKKKRVEQYNMNVKAKVTEKMVKINKGFKCSFLYI